MNKKTRIFSLMCGLLILMLASCSKDNDTVARELLATVPSNAGAVVLFDGEQMVEKAGGEKAVMASIGKQLSPKAQNLLTVVQDTWSPTAVVVFLDGENSYITTRVDNPSDLIAAIEKQSGKKLAVDGDLTYDGTVCVAGNQVWVATGNSSLSATSIKKYLQYSENQSFAGVDYCDKMVESNDDISGLLNVSSLVSVFSGGFQKSAATQMALSTLFDNAAYLSVEGDFEKGKMELDMKVLNAKFKTAKFLLPVGKIDPSVVKKTSETAGAILALNIDSKLVEKIKNAAKSFGGALPEQWLNMLNPLDGTIAIAGENPGSSLKGIVTTNGQSTIALSQLLAEYGVQTSLSGKDLLVSQGGTDVTGPINVASVADKFKGAWIGYIGNGLGMYNAPYINLCYMMLTPADGGLELKIEATFQDKNVNALQQIVSAK